MNTKDQLVMEILSIAKDFNERERAALRAFIHAIRNGQTPDEAQAAGDAILKN